MPIIPEAAISETGGDQLFQIFFKELRRHGYEEGRTIDFDRWSARGNPARYPELAREVVRSQPDVIYTFDTDQVRALLALTTTIPVVALNANLVGAGFAESVSRPGRNVTGIVAAFSDVEFVLKRFKLLQDLVPTASRIAVPLRRPFWDADRTRQFRDAAVRIGITWVGALLDDPVQPAEYRRIFAAMPDQRIDAVYVIENADNWVHRDLIVDLALESRLPVVSGFREMTARGALMSYGLDSSWRPLTMADLVVRVLRGEKPADMPLRSPDKFELMINLKTARMLGITVPPAILHAADEVIE